MFREIAVLLAVLVPGVLGVPGTAYADELPKADAPTLPTVNDDLPRLGGPGRSNGQDWI